MSFLMTNGLKALSKSETFGLCGDGEVEGVVGLVLWEGEAAVDEAAVDVEALGLPKKLDMIERDLSWASFSFRSFSALAAFFSNLSFS